MLLLLLLLLLMVKMISVINGHLTVTAAAQSVMLIDNTQSGLTTAPNTLSNSC